MWTESRKLEQYEEGGDGLQEGLELTHLCKLPWHSA